jgi:hypothetical protein
MPTIREMREATCASIMTGTRMVTGRAIKDAIRNRGTAERAAVTGEVTDEMLKVWILKSRPWLVLPEKEYLLLLS